MSTLVFPIFPWVFQVIVIGYFVAVAVYLASAGKASFKVVGPNNSSVNCSCHLVIVSVNLCVKTLFLLLILFIAHIWQDSKGTCSPIGFKEICAKECPDATCQFFENGGNPYMIWLHVSMNKSFKRN